MTTPAVLSAVSGATVSHTQTTADLSVQRGSDLPRYCAQLSALLAKQPVSGNDLVLGPCRVISLDSFFDMRICELFHAIADQTSGAEFQWNLIYYDHVSTSSVPNSPVGTHGLALFINDISDMCSFETLHGRYNQIYERMKTGWVNAKLAECPDILHKENPDEFELFVKDSPSFGEDSLIRFIALRFSLNEDLKCGNAWKEHLGYRHGNLYLWIRKSALEMVVDTFGFEFSQRESVHKAQ